MLTVIYILLGVIILLMYAVARLMDRRDGRGNGHIEIPAATYRPKPPGRRE